MKENTQLELGHGKGYQRDTEHHRLGELHIDSEYQCNMSTTRVAPTACVNTLNTCKYVVIRNVTREECSTHAVMALFLACIASDEADACMGTLYAGRAQDA